MQKVERLCNNCALPLHGVPLRGIFVSLLLSFRSHLSTNTEHSLIILFTVYAVVKFFYSRVADDLSFETQATPMNVYHKHI